MILQGRPRESVFHFPIKERLEALLRSSPAFGEALHHELTRPKPNKGIMAGRFCFVNIKIINSQQQLSDVYDSPAWKKMMGESTDRLERIGLLFCIDGIPAFNYKVGSFY